MFQYENQEFLTAEFPFFSFHFSLLGAFESTHNKYFQIKNAFQSQNRFFMHIKIKKIWF